MEEKFIKEIGELIRNQRRARDYSQEYMAKKLAISQSVYSQIESGKVKCSGFKLMKIFKLLGIDPGNLLENVY